MTWGSSVTRKMILKWFMKKNLEIVWPGLRWLWVRSSGGLKEYSIASSGCMNHRAVWRSQEIHFKGPFFLRLFVSWTDQFLSV